MYKILTYFPDILYYWKKAFQKAFDQYVCTNEIWHLQAKSFKHYWWQTQVDRNQSTSLEKLWSCAIWSKKITRYVLRFTNCVSPRDTWLQLCILLFEEEEKAMIRNWSNRIPLPSPDTIRKRNTKGWHKQQHKLKAKRAALSQQMSTRLS